MTLHRGYDLPATKRVEGLVPVIGSSGITGTHSVAKLDGPNVITGRYGTIGEVIYHDGPCWPLNTTLYVSDFHDNNPRYVAYLLQVALNATYLDGTDKSTVPGVDRNVLHEFSIPFVEDKAGQQRIVDVLYAIDDKIENNRKLMAELEATARLVYDEWFVRFDFPDEQGRPYRSSGGKMVWNDQLKREIPARWKVEQLGQVCETRLGGTPSTDVAAYWNGNIPWLNSAEVADSPILEAAKSITERGVHDSATSFAPAGSVLLSITRYIRPSILAIDSCFNQSVVAVLENDDLHCEYLYPFMQSQVPRYLTLRTGAQQPHINKETVDSTWVAVPARQVLDYYYDSVHPIMQAYLNTARTKLGLRHLRDWLLPMLMNGQITVGE